MSCMNLSNGLWSNMGLAPRHFHPMRGTVPLACELAAQNRTAPKDSTNCRLTHDSHRRPAPARILPGTAVHEDSRLRRIALLSAALTLALASVCAPAQESRLPDIGSSAGELLTPRRQREYGA